MAVAVGTSSVRPKRNVKSRIQFPIPRPLVNGLADLSFSKSNLSTTSDFASHRSILSVYITVGQLFLLRREKM